MLPAGSTASFRRLVEVFGMVQPAGQMLQAVRIFADVPPDELETLAKRCRWKHYREDQQIISHLDESTDVFFVIEGLVRVIIYSQSGREITFRDVPAGKYFGELAAIDHLPRSATVAALTDSLVASMSAELFWEVLRTHPDVMATLLKELAGAVRLLTERVFEFSALAVSNRVHAELLRLARDHMIGDNSALIRPVPTHAEIASRISTHREAVTRELNQLAHDGLVERQTGAMLVRDVARLACLVRDVVGH